MDTSLTHEERIERLEKDSHPPMPYIICEYCYCLVREQDRFGHEVAAHPELDAE
jgi:hypothetical protein